MKNVRARGGDVVRFKILAYTVVFLLAVICVLPFWLIIVGSLSDESTIRIYGYSFLPRGFSFSAYQMIFRIPEEILNSYRTSILVTFFGTLAQLTICSMAGYVLSRKDFKYRNRISFFFFFTTIFNAGLVPWYILCVKYLHFKSHPYLALILPGLFSYFYVIIMRSFMSEIPMSISESAKIDGANDFMIFTRLILPLSKPVLATVGLFGALQYWNDWYNAMLFSTAKQFYPLQYYLYTVLNSSRALSQIGSATSAAAALSLPTETYKLAMTVVATGPIVLLYPFLQKYFIKGMTVGSVKG